MARQLDEYCPYEGLEEPNLTASAVRGGLLTKLAVSEAMLPSEPMLIMTLLLLLLSPFPSMVALGARQSHWCTANFCNMHNHG